MNKTRTPKRIQRFWEQVDKSGDCWQWLRPAGNKGYGQFWFEGRMRATHRLSYELTKGNVPEGLQLDHLCRNKLCVNPDHLEPVTMAENLRRSPLSNVNKTHCKRGHEFTPDNIVKVPGGRACKVCRRATWRKWYATTRQTALNS